MRTTLKTAALSALIGLSALAGLSSTASADGLYLNFGGHGGPRGGVYLGDSHHADWRAHRPVANRCTPERALNKADRMGLNRVRIADTSARSITVRGRQHGRTAFVTFARAPGCPVIGR